MKKAGFTSLGCRRGQAPPTPYPLLLFLLNVLLLAFLLELPPPFSPRTIHLEILKTADELNLNFILYFDVFAFFVLIFFSLFDLSSESFLRRGSSAFSGLHDFFILSALCLLGFFYLISGFALGLFVLVTSLFRLYFTNFQRFSQAQINGLSGLAAFSLLLVLAWVWGYFNFRQRRRK